ncbi:hypothetical protein BOX15_Mlig010399g3 [Macrostomum lignano]|uniref:Uncharacterized protein n=1 Tax=Macrostomum lignano TaxID=282301 RepID=A0A267DE15_9PLAT|nr:hypothetical protein BOX15_Mlig010399g3 [Macrostomum lignano]
MAQHKLLKRSTIFALIVIHLYLIITPSNKALGRRRDQEELTYCKGKMRWWVIVRQRVTLFASNFGGAKAYVYFNRILPPSGLLQWHSYEMRRHVAPNMGADVVFLDKNHYIVPAYSYYRLRRMARLRKGSFNEINGHLLLGSHVHMYHYMRYEYTTVDGGSCGDTFT